MKYLWVLILLMPLICFGHSKVVFTKPAQGATLENPPKIVIIQFNKDIETHFNTAELWTNGRWSGLSSKVDKRTLVIDMHSVDEKRIRIRWNVISKDGHSQRGTLEFSIK